MISASNFYNLKGIQPPPSPPILKFRCVQDVPKQQPKLGDCGVFILMFIEYLT